MSTSPIKYGSLTKYSGMAAALALSAGANAASMPSVYGAHMARQLDWIAPITCFTKAVPNQNEITAPPLTANEIATWMRDEGLPIATIADITGVERKTVYAWLSGNAVKSQNQLRLESLHSLLSANKEASLRSLYRFWNRQGAGGKSLSELFREPRLDTRAVRSMLAELWPLAKKQQNLASSSGVLDRNTKANPFVRDTREAYLSDDS